MKGTSRNAEVEEIVQAIKNTKGVTGVHDMHIWLITSSMNALIAHVVVNGNKTVYETEALLKKIEYKIFMKRIFLDLFINTYIVTDI